MALFDLEVRAEPDDQQFARCIAAHLEFIRLKNGLSKLSVAQRAGLDQRIITFIEKAVNISSVVTLFRICGAIGADIGKITGAAAKGKFPTD